jgi:hypothetical protein
MPIESYDEGRPPSGDLPGPAGFRRPLETHDAEHTDLGDRSLHAARAICEDARSVLARADLAFELNVILVRVPA